MTLSRIATADMGDSYECWAGSDPNAVALHARATETANPGLIEEFQSRVADGANAWLADHASDTTDMSDEDAREVEISDYNDSVDVEAIAGKLLAADGDEALSASIQAGVAAVLDSVAEHPGSFALIAADGPDIIVPNPFRADADEASLWQHYSGQQEAQPVYVELDLSDGGWTVDYDGEVGGSVPASVWHQVVRRYPLRVIPTTTAANQLLADLAPIAQRILDGATVECDRNGNEVGLLNAAAQDAADELQAALDDWGTDQDIVAVWTIDAIDLADWPEITEQITATTTDAEINTLADEMMSDLASNSGNPVAVCDGLTEHLAGIRDDAADA